MCARGGWEGVNIDPIERGNTGLMEGKYVVSTTHDFVKTVLDTNIQHFKAVQDLPQVQSNMLREVSCVAQTLRFYMTISVVLAYTTISVVLATKHVVCFVSSNSFQNSYL